MSTFTMRLKRAVELKPANMSTDEWLGLNAYPIFDPDYREPLNQKIYDHFWNREIGMETVLSFQLAVKRRMNESMPLFNQLYASANQLYDPLVTVDIETTSESTGNQSSTNSETSTSETASNAKSRAVNSDMPQIMLSGNGDYATSGADSFADTAVESSGNGEASGNVDSTQANTSSTKGYQGVPAELIMAQRAAFLNVDMLVLDALEDCFMGIWSNRDEMLPPGYGTGFYHSGMLGGIY